MTDKEIFEQMIALLGAMKESRTEERSVANRYKAIAISQMEIVLAVWQVYVAHRAN